MNRRVFLINDKIVYNNTYRSSLKNMLEQSGCVVQSVSPFRNGRVSIIHALKILLDHKGFQVSSNLRSNIFALLQPWRRGMIILNGLGRYRWKHQFRAILIILIRLNSRKSIAVQSYADYRYLKRLVKHKSLLWVPGSGGYLRKTGAANRAVIVQRDDKLELVKSDLTQFLSGSKTDLKITVVGCRNTGLVEHVFDGFEVDNIGFVPQSEIFSTSKIFLQPSGYGEGFPHTLADAIVSGMKIFISKTEYLRSGVWKLNGQYKDIMNGWGELCYGPELQRQVSSDCITTLYLLVFQVGSGWDDIEGKLSLKQCNDESSSKSVED